MEITLEKQSEVNALLKINISETDYQEKLEKSIKNFSKQAVVKGFRPGKVPAGLIKQRFGKDLKIEEVNRLVGDTVDNYLKDNEVKILGRPVINREKADQINWSDTEMAFEFELGLSPEFAYKLDKDVVLEKYVVELTEKELNDIIENLRKNYAESTEADDIAEDDFVRGKLTQIGVENGFDQETTLPIVQLKPEYRTLFVGKKKDEVIEIEDVNIIFEKENGLKLWTGVSDEALTGMTGKFTFTPTSVMRREPAELNNAFFDRVLGVGKAETEEDFRKQLKETVEKDYSLSTQNLLRQEIIKKLVKETEINLPDEFLKKFIKQSNTEKDLSDEEVATSYESYRDTLKQQLIESKIADDFEVKFDGGEVIDRTKAMWREQFASYGMAADGDEEFEKRLTTLVTNYLFKDNNGENYRNMFDRIFSEKVLDKAETLVSITEKPVSTEEFNAIVEKVNAENKALAEAEEVENN